MKAQQILNRLRAFHAGKPLPQYDTLHFPIAADRDVLVLAFLRMGGESAPWGVAFGRPGRKPTLLTVPEARNRDLVADMAAKLAPVLLEHFHHPDYADLNEAPDLDRLPLRQVWLPNASHLEMLHHLAYAYTFTKWGDPERARTLRRLGRLVGWLFRESQRPGQPTVMVATEGLKRSYVFPAQDIRQSHLGFLMAWLATPGSRQKREAAAAVAEQLAISTTLDPALERDQLTDEVEGYNEAVKAENARAAAAAADRIRRLLEAELLRRFSLTVSAIEALRADNRRVNAGAVELVQSSRKEFWYRYLRAEVERRTRGEANVYTPSPETDRHPRAAAQHYYLHAASEEALLAALLHDDEALQEEAIAAGDAFRGTIRAVRDEGTGRCTKPVWTVSSPIEVTRLREGSSLCVAGLRSREVRVRQVDRGGAGGLVLEVEVTSLKTLPRSGQKGVLLGNDPRHVGKTVTLLPLSGQGISERKAQRVWDRGTPGSWLTDGLPGGLKALLPPEVADNVRAAIGD